MSTDETTAARGRAAFQVLVGEWTEQVLVPDIPAGRVVFEPVLDGRYLVQRSDIPQAEFPDSIAIITYDPEADAYRQHYFDSRGIVRVYKMDLRDGVWTLLRDEPDFTPLHFLQRFEGRFSADGNTIEARWETSEDGGTTWNLDFPLRYTRVG